MAINKSAVQNSSEQIRYVLIGVLVVAAFFGAYKFASASSARSASTNAPVAAVTPGAAAASTGGGASAAGGCCGGGASGAAGTSAAGGCCGGGATASKPVAGSATVSGGVQKVTIDLTTGSYSPNKITAKAGIPLELDFKGPASGCNGQVVSQDLGFQQDVSQGGTIKVGALKPGTYKFTCSMGMYVGQIVVE